MQRSSFVGCSLLIVGCLSLTTLLGGVSPQPLRPAPANLPPEIINEVLTLLDSEFAFDSERGIVSWESRPFDTAQYDRIGLRAETESEPGTIITCTTHWQFDRDDTFEPGLPRNYGPVIGAIGDDSSLRPLLAPGVPFSAVEGMRAKVVCTGSRPSVDPPGSEPVPFSGTIVDVKVLLRRE